MSSLFQRYEASVKLSNGKVVVYHNINTGLKKFHKFLCHKFDTPDRWIAYSVRRKVNKEIVGRFKNSIPRVEIRSVTIFTKTIDNDKKTGVFIPIKFKRNGYEITRNMFVATKMIININSLLITIPEWIFEKMISNGKKELYEYYLNQEHQISFSEIEISSSMHFIREKVIKDEILGTEPEQDYP
ncbi:MAG: hypothetical protein Q4G16_08780 [Cruoricaptor ignavus]|nr:hypothetical protein [Cruoricaptor ignavus]